MIRPVVIKIVGLATGEASDVDGQWVKAYSAEAFGGRGDMLTTANPPEAIRFPGRLAAWDFWRQVPTNRPTRADGQPNRPLTAFTVTFEPAPEDS